MAKREIPFRPRLEGDFRIRFYEAVSNIHNNTDLMTIEKIVKKEILWVETECTFNLEQRKKYRAIWFLFRDLIRASWKAYYKDGVLLMSLPRLNDSDIHDPSSPEVKALLRSWMKESRHERLVTYTDFINYIENPGKTKKSISCLIANGDELAERLEKAKHGTLDPCQAVRPYLQLVCENEKDEFTGLKLSEIWRYFRLTWSTPTETTPGRTMQYLIRDAAHPMHAVMGIASLENCAVQITCRDNYIGWNQQAFIDKVITLTSDEAKAELEKLLSYLEDGIAGIDYSHLCKPIAIQDPTEEDIQKLLNIASRAEETRQTLLKNSDTNNSFGEKSSLGNISVNTEMALYTRKRAEQLARLLTAKRAIQGIICSESYKDNWKDFCKSELGNSAIRCALVAQKTKHIGSSMLELNVCGAIPPYNEVLGGKLVALLALSPQIIHDYKEKYSNRSSEIASRLKGMPVYRPADLVYVGTTSLYYVGSSQYNRLKLPKEVFESNSDIKWKRLGMTFGYGTMHISKATTMSLTEATNEEDGYNRFNHVFGEGASPKMRLLSKSIRELLESSNDDSKEFSKHAMSRIVYGACLADNTKEYLLGKEDKPDYYTEMDDYKAGTQKIINFWSKRWLSSRLNYEPIYSRIRSFDKNAFMVSNEINGSEKWTFTELKEVSPMPKINHQVGLQFIRDYYRGSSAYADYVDGEFLNSMHVVTKLDQAILDAALAGKDIVLTGNPGDGKTHIIRILKEKLEKSGKNVVIELDASTLTDSDLYEHWKTAREQGKPYIIAINAAVLYSLYKYNPNFEPVKKAYYQMSHSVVFHTEDLDSDDLVVFNLSKREILTSEFLEKVISRLTDDKHYSECKECPLKENCDVSRNRELLNNKLFQLRLTKIFTRIKLRGYHATLRELQSFISYLIFGDRDCKKIFKTIGDFRYDIVNLVYSGKGRLFEVLKRSLDPVNISHPIWDEHILLNDMPDNTWTSDNYTTKESIVYDNIELFRLRKRQFYFFNQHGDTLLKIIDDDVQHFQNFLQQDDRKIIKELIRKINCFFGNIKASSELEIWIGHRYNNDPRKVLISVGKRLKQHDFVIGRPTLLTSMQAGIEMTANYLRFEKKSEKGTFLKIDFDMYVLLSEAECGVPVLFMESDLVKKVWLFIEHLQSEEEIEDQEDISISLFDVQNKKEIRVNIDTVDNRYTSIESIKK